MAQRLSEQVVEWLTVGGDAFTPQNSNSVPLVVSKPGQTVTIPATNGTAIGIYNNQGQLWTVGAAGATTSVKSSQLIVSSSDAAAGAGAALELWRGTDVSWQLRADNSTDQLIIANNWTTAAQTSYTSNVSFGYGAVANQYVHIYSTLDSSYSYGGASGSALSVAGGATFAKKVYINDTTDSNYATVAGSFVTKGGAYIAKKTYIADTTDSNYATLAGALVVAGGANIGKKVYIKDTTDSNYATLAGSIVTAGGLYVTKKTYIADTTDSNYTTLAGALVVAGGANFGKKVYLKDATDSTSYTTGSLVTAGGIAITKQLRVQGVTTHGGNVLSDTNATDDIGATATRWKNGYFSTSVNVGAASTSHSSTDAKNTEIAPGIIYANTNSTGTSYGFLMYGKGAQYGSFSIKTFGTANVPATEEGGTGTAGTTGVTELTLGNATAVNTNTAYGSSASGANNAQGQLTLYQPNTKYGSIVPSQTSTGNNIYYLPRLYTSTSTYYGKLVALYKSTSAGDSFSDVGSGTKPVYVTGNGVVTASTSTVGSGVIPMYLSSGTLTASTSTVGSGVKPIYLSSGTLTVSNSTVGSGVKPIYLSSGTLTVSSSSLGGTAQPVYMASGELKAISATVGSATKPIYLNSGTITVSNGTVGSGVIPMYLSSGTLTASTSTVGSGVKPVYLSSGTITVSSSSVGGTAQPVYLSNGEIKGISATVGAVAGAPVYLNAGTITVMTDISLTKSSTSTVSVNVGNSNGAVELLASTNRGVYDTTNSKWIVYTAKAADHTYIPLWASKGSETNPVYFNSSGEPVACAPEVAYWSISNTSAAASGANDQQAMRQITAIQGVFSSHNNDHPEAFTMATGNRSVAFGYLIAGTSYNTTGTAFGGYFIAHYNTPKYLGINSGSWQMHTLIKGHSSGYYGSSTPSTGFTGDVFFKTV